MGSTIKGLLPFQSQNSNSSRKRKFDQVSFDEDDKFENDEPEKKRLKVNNINDISTDNNDDILSWHQLQDTADSYLVIPKQLSRVDSLNAFQWRNKWKNISISNNNATSIQLKELKYNSLSSYLQSSESQTVQKNFYDFNSKRDIDNNNNNNMNAWHFIDNQRKFEKNIFKKPSLDIPSRWNIDMLPFPTLIGQIKQGTFIKHNELKKYMNLYEVNDSNDIFNRKMSEKLNINKKWNVVGLIDPDKNLSTLDHSLDSKLYDYDIMNYHHWIPSVFKVNRDLTECRLLSEIPNLNPYKYRNTLYPLIEQLFLYQIPQFQCITNMNLTNIPLKVIVKAQNYQLFNCELNDCYLGNMHKEGLYEDIIGVGLYYYHIDGDINGGELEISSVIKVKNDWEYSNRTTLKDIKINIKEKTSFVFSNDLCYHRVNKLYGNGQRKMMAFFLLRPNITENIAIDARFVVVNWKYHTHHLVLKWLKQINNHHYQWMLQIIFQFVIGSNKYIQNATEIYNKCRTRYVDEITYNESDITSNGTRRQIVHLD